MPRAVLALGVVSLCMDMSSEMIHSLLPVFLVTSLGASTVAVGMIEGLAEATANVSKVFSGLLSDRMRRRKPLLVAGYGLAALTKPFFALATTLWPVVAARFLDRVGKGIRGAPRDALIADITPLQLRGAAYGLRQSLDTVGAFLGPLLAVALMLATQGSFRLVFWVATVPAVFAVGVLFLAVQEPTRIEERAAGAASDDEATSAGSRSRPSLRAAVRIGRPFHVLVGIAAILTLARFSEAFLILRAEDTGLGVALVPLVLVVMNVTYAASSWPAGVLADRTGHRGMLTAGIVLLLLSHLVLAGASTVVMTLAGVAVWGLHMGCTQGVLSAMVADIAPAHLRGSAFGIFNLVVGLAMLPASVIAGFLWYRWGPSATFGAGAAFAAVALGGVLASRPPRRPAG